MKKFGLVCVLMLGMVAGAICQDNDPNVILITLDGFRWQELFEGADSLLLINKQATRDEHAAISYWHQDARRRREILMPFFWSEVATHGQLLGNRNYENKVNCDNPHWFSYPGYNELLTGFVDPRIRSNDTIDNPNMTVFEFISHQPGYENKVAAFGTWGVFPFIFREDSSRIYVNAGEDEATPLITPITEREQLLNELQGLMPNPVTERHDVFTMFYAIEYMKREHPKAVFIGFDETDSYAHGGMYDKYLDAAHRSDALIKKLWTFIQSDPRYRNNTTLIITTDHGRGRGYRHDKMNWRSHGRLALGSGEVWVAAIGPDIPAAGEIMEDDKATLSQVASTVAAVLGFDYTNARPVAKPLDTIIPNKVNSVVINR
jgi:hypothetical protein